MSMMGILNEPSVGARVAAQQTRGFDYLRIALACSVILWHSFNVSYGTASDMAVRGTGLDLLIRSIMPVFFALSGFLVASSLERLQYLPTFLWFRFLRIFPALVVEVALSALILGPLVTVYPIHLYFSDVAFAQYFLNILGWVHFELPGVFLDLPKQGIVNFSLWTVPSELECYILLAALFAVGMFSSGRSIWLIVAAYAVFACVIHPSDLYDRYTLIPARVLPLSFLAGVGFWRSRDWIPASLPLAGWAFVVTLLFLIHPKTCGLAAVSAAYVAVALGCTDAPHSRLLASGDYSYGLYLYAYPLQQSMVLLIGPERPLATLVLTMAAASAFAVLSWHMVEKHAQRFKHVVKRPRLPRAVFRRTARRSLRPAGVVERLAHMTARR